MNKPTSFSGSGTFRYEPGDLEAMQAAVNYYRWILDFFQPFLGRKILEVGAGTGNFTTALLKRYHNGIEQYTALEPEPGLFKTMQQRLEAYPPGLVQYQKAFLADALRELTGKEIDTVIYVNVLEHVEDDTEELSQAATLLNEGGYLLTFTPAMPVLYSRFDRSLGHYRRYTLPQMKHKMTKAGLRIEKAHYVDFPGFFLWWIKYRLLKHTTMKKSQVHLYDRLVVPLLRKLEPCRFLPFGKNIVVIGEKER